MKRLFLLVVITVICISVLTVFSFISCRVEEAVVAGEGAVSLMDKIKEEGRKPVIGFIYLQDDVYIDGLIRGVQLNCDEYGYELILKNSQGDASLTEQHLNSLIAQKVDVILLHTLEPDRLRPTVIEAYNQDIPLICVNLWVDAPQAGYVGVDFLRQGEIMGEIVVEALDGKGTMVHIHSDPADTSIAGMREAGMLSVVEQYPDIKLLDTQYAFNSREESYTLTEQLLTAHPDVDLIAVMSVLQTLGTLAVLEERGLLGEIKVVIYDLPKTIVPEIEAGHIYGTSHDNPVRIAKTAIDLATFVLTAVHQADNWPELEKEAPAEPAWKQYWGVIPTGSNKTTINNIDVNKDLAF